MAYSHVEASLCASVTESPGATQVPPLTSVPGETADGANRIIKNTIINR
jgi:hypothetical protein